MFDFYLLLITDNCQTDIFGDEKCCLVKYFECEWEWGVCFIYKGSRIKSMTIFIQNTTLYQKV